MRPFRMGLARPSKHRNPARHGAGVRDAFSVGSRGSQAVMAARRQRIAKHPGRAFYVLADGTEISFFDVFTGRAHLPAADAVGSQAHSNAARKARNKRKRASRSYRAHRRRHDAP